MAGAGRGDGFGEARPLLVGTELLAHPDVFATLRRRTAADFRTDVVITRVETGAPGDDGSSRA